MTAPERPSPARIGDYWLGGKNNTPEDRKAADAIEAACPRARQLAGDARRFRDRAAALAHAAGISQFVDLGCGTLPPAPWTPLHVTYPSAAVGYVDADPLVAGEVAALTDGRHGVAVACRDLRDIQRVWDGPALSVIRKDEPLCILLTLTLHLMAPDEAERVVAGYASLAVPGSVLIVSVPVLGTPQAVEAVRAIGLNPHDFTPGQFDALLDGMNVEASGVVNRLGWVDPGPPPGGAHILGGVAATICACPCGRCRDCGLCLAAGCVPAPRMPREPMRVKRVQSGA